MSLTTRLVSRSLVVMALALAAVSLLTYELVRVSGREDLDALLSDASSQLVATFSTEATDASGVDAVLSAPEARSAARSALTLQPSGTQYVVAITIDSTRLQASGGPPAAAALLRGANAPSIEAGTLRTVDTEAGPARVLDTEVTDHTGATIAVVTALALLEPSRDAAVDALTRTALAGVVALTVGGAVLAYVVRRSLRPLRELSASAAEVTADTLDARVPVPPRDDEVRRLARELNGMLERIEEGDQTRRRHLAAVSHEVRTPLTVAEGHLELLGDRLVDPVSTAATVRVELDRLRRILDDLLAVGRGVDEIDIRLGPIFVPDLFASVETRIEALGLTDRVEVLAAPNVAFTGDQARIEQSITNLVSNVVDHNPPDTTAIVSAWLEQANVAISVSDDGGGIDQDLADRVLEPFVTSRTAGRGRSSGLGLAVVDALTRAQHGTVRIRSDERGTTVTLVLPTTPEDAARV